MLQQTASSPTALTNGTWLVDPKGGRIAFAVKGMWGLVDVKGTFDRFEGALHITERGAIGELVVHTESLDTKNKKRDAHLRSADFFNSETYPRMTFVATGMKSGPTGPIVSGDLTVGAGSTRLSLPVTLDGDGEEAVMLRATTTLPREDVGLAWNKAGMIKGDARLEIELRLLVPA